MVLFFCFSSRTPDLCTWFGQAQHPTPFPTTARSAAERARRPAVLRSREDFGEFRPGRGHQRPHRALAHTHACAPAPHPARLPKLPPRLPRRRVSASPGLPPLSSRGPHGLGCRASGSLRSPPVSASRAAGSVPSCSPGLGRRGSAPARGLPSPARRRGRKAARAGAQAPPGHRAAGTGSHGAGACGDPGMWPQPPGGPSLGLCVSAAAAASRAWGQ